MKKSHICSVEAARFIKQTKVAYETKESNQKYAELKALCDHECDEYAEMVIANERLKETNEEYVAKNLSYERMCRKECAVNIMLKKKNKRDWINT